MSDFHLGALVYCAVAVGCSSAPPEAAQVFVPAGDFRAGANCVDGNAEMSCDSSPLRRRTVIHLDAFFVDRRLARRDEYRQCVNARACAVEDLRPLTAATLDHYSVKATDGFVANVRLDGAKAYCRWRGARLQTSNEFERVARGTDGRLTPWGAGPSPCPNETLVSDRCRRAMGPAGAREIAYSPQWVDVLDRRYPFGMIRGHDDTPFAAMNQDMSLAEDSWQPVLYAGIRCARSASSWLDTGRAAGSSSAPTHPPDALSATARSW